MANENHQRLSPGDAFPELELEAPEGKVSVAERLREGPAVVAFERHFG